MSRRIRLFLSIAVLSLGSIVTAVGFDLNPPSWRSDPYTTTQQWQFLTDDPQPYADTWDNPFGQMQAEVLPANVVSSYDFLSGSWKWENLGLAPEAHTMMQINTWPNWPDSATNKKAWVQITWGVDFHGTTPPYDQADMLYLSPFYGIDGIFPTPAIDAQILGVDDTVEWYHTTFQIPFVYSELVEDEFGNIDIVEEDAPWGAMFVYPFAGMFSPEPLTDSYDIYISGIVVDTICVPEPAMITLMTLGGLILRRKS